MRDERMREDSGLHYLRLGTCCGPNQSERGMVATKHRRVESTLLSTSLHPSFQISAPYQGSVVSELAA